MLSLQKEYITEKEHQTSINHRIAVAIEQCDLTANLPSCFNSEETGFNHKNYADINPAEFGKNAMLQGH